MRDVLNDPYASRSQVPSWVSFAFNDMLMRLLERGPSVAVVKRGLQAALHDYNSQKECAEGFGDHVLPGLMYDRQEAERNVDLLCAVARKQWPMTYFGTFTCAPGISPTLERCIVGCTASALIHECLPSTCNLHGTGHRKRSSS